MTITRSKTRSPDTPRSKGKRKQYTPKKCKHPTVLDRSKYYQDIGLVGVKLFGEEQRGQGCSLEIALKKTVDVPIGNKKQDEGDHSFFTWQSLLKYIAKPKEWKKKWFPW